MPTVTVTRIGQERMRREIHLSSEGASISSIVEQAGIDTRDKEFRVNGAICEPDHIVSQGGTIAVIDKSTVDGAGVRVRVGKLPGRIDEYALTGEPTVRAAIEVARVDPTGYEVRVNGEPATLEQRLNRLDTVVLIKPVRGAQQSRFGTSTSYSSDPSTRTVCFGVLLC